MSTASQDRNTVIDMTAAFDRLGIGAPGKPLTERVEELEVAIRERQANCRHARDPHNPRRCTLCNAWPLA